MRFAFWFSDRVRFFGWLVAAMLCFTHAVRAETLQAPIGGKPFSLDGRFVCTATVEGGFSVEQGGRWLRPPSAPSAVGQVVEVTVAASAAACAENPDRISLIATQRWPSFDASSIVFSPDDGRIEARGRALDGAIVVWSLHDKTGSDTCRDPAPDGDLARCAWAVGAAAPAGADTTFIWLPAGARAEADAVFFDASGRRAPADAFTFVPARTVLRKLVPSDATVDLSTGRGEVELVHPEAVASAECKGLLCEMADDTLVVHGASSLTNQLEVKLRLVPHVVFATKDGFDQQLTAKLAVLHCPMTIVSGAPVRNDDDARVVVKLQGGCARELSSMRFTSERGPAALLQSVVVQDATFVLLGLGDVDAESLTLTALRGGPEGIVLAVAHTPTRNTPRVRATVEVQGFPNVDFIPNNRTGQVHAPAPGEHEHYALIAIDGVYAADNAADGTMTIHGDPNAAGLTELRFGLRNTALPPPFDTADLAQVQDSLQRSIHEANIPAPLGEGALGKTPFVEMLCGAGKDAKRLPIGVTDHLPFELRDTCRVVFHRDRLAKEFGTQRINFEIDVIRSDGTIRPEAHVSEVVTLRAGGEPRSAWIHGVLDPFDRVVVRLSHVADEAHYLGAAEIKTGAPAVQWSAVLGTGHVRLYGTTAIPTGLYRFSDSAHSGVLTLNFGVISRLTWLDSEGHEGFLGAEGGIMVIGLANSRSDSGNSLTQVGAVLGLGVSVPIANRSLATQASINLHGWLEADITRSGSKDSKGRYAFIFGPSITIGNVGVNL